MNVHFGYASKCYEMLNFFLYYVLVYIERVYTSITYIQVVKSIIINESLHCCQISWVFSISTINIPAYYFQQDKIKKNILHESLILLKKK